MARDEVAKAFTTRVGEEFIAGRRPIKPMRLGGEHAANGGPRQPSGRHQAEMPKTRLTRQGKLAAAGAGTVVAGGGSAAAAQRRRDDIAKANNQSSPGRTAATAAFPAWHGAVAGRKNKKLRATGNEYAGYVAGGVAGGLGAGALTHGSGSAKAHIARSLAGSLGGAAGAVAGGRRNERKGYLKPVKSNVSKSGTSVVRSGINMGGHAAEDVGFKIGPRKPPKDRRARTRYAFAPSAVGVGLAGATAGGVTAHRVVPDEKKLVRKDYQRSTRAERAKWTPAQRDTRQGSTDRGEGSGALVGAAAGAAVGALAGKGSRGLGAKIGAYGGGVTGAAAGHRNGERAGTVKARNQHEAMLRRRQERAQSVSKAGPLSALTGTLKDAKNGMAAGLSGSSAQFQGSGARAMNAGARAGKLTRTAAVPAAAGAATGAAATAAVKRRPSTSQGSGSGW